MPLSHARYVSCMCSIAYALNACTAHGARIGIAYGVNIWQSDAINMRKEYAINIWLTHSAHISIAPGFRRMRNVVVMCYQYENSICYTHLLVRSKIQCDFPVLHNYALINCFAFAKYLYLALLQSNLVFTSDAKTYIFYENNHQCPKYFEQLYFH
jgi:hypothetical protein